MPSIAKKTALFPYGHFKAVKCGAPALLVFGGFAFFGQRGFGRVYALCAEPVIDKVEQCPKARNAYYAVNDSCAHIRSGGEHPIDYVEVENAHAEPIYRTDDYKY